MTTKITISSASWPVRITGETKEGYGWNSEPEQIVAPNSETDVYIHALKRLVIEEMPVYDAPELVEDKDELQARNDAVIPVIPKKKGPPFKTAHK